MTIDNAAIVQRYRDAARKHRAMIARLVSELGYDTDSELVTAREALAVHCEISATDFEARLAAWQ